MGHFECYILLKMSAHGRVRRQHAIGHVEHLAPVILDLRIARLVVETVMVHVLLAD